MSKKSIQSKTMKELVEEAGDNLISLKEGTTVEVEVQKITKNRIVVNVSDFCSGMIPEKEFPLDIADLKVGDKVMAYLLNLENEEGKAVLSLKRADKERIWKSLASKSQAGEVLKVKIKEANRGGLVAIYSNLEGFIPVSQLASQHYPIVKNDPYEIIKALKGLIGQILEVKIINIDQSNNKLIFSEKEVTQANRKEEIKKIYKIGQVIKGKVSSIVPFGLFINLGNIEGLVHISEVAWERVNDLGKLYKTGDEIDVEVIGLENGKISLSIKRLTIDPWLKKVKNYQADQVVEGKITRITPFGAFAELDEGILGLVHISELALRAKDSKVAKIEDLLELGKAYKFKILSIDPNTHKINLSLAVNGTKEKSSKTKTTAKKK